MTTPSHPSMSVHLRVPADETHRLLRTDPQSTVAEATAAALHRVVPLLRSWGLVTTALPTVSAARAGEGELGSIAIRWRGEERATGWPAADARLLVTPTGASASELILLSERPLGPGLAAPQLDRLHQRQAIDVLVGSFLRATAELIERAHVRPLERVEVA